MSRSARARIANIAEVSFRPAPASNGVLEARVRKAIVLFTLVLLFSCKKEESSTSIASETVASPQVVANAKVAADQGVRHDAGASARDGFAALGVTAVAERSASPRMILRTAQMRIVVGDTTKTVDAVTKAIEAMGGFVAGSNIWRDGELMRATLTLRVPSDKLTAALSSIRSLAKRVDTEAIASEDVSQEYVDLTSHVRNLEATENELRELLVVARKNSRKATDVLEVHEQLTNIRGQIEHDKGRMRYLSELASLSSISLEMTPDAIAKSLVEPGWQPIVIAKDAVRALIGALQSIATVGIWLIVYVVPVFAMFALLIVALWKIARRSRAREVHE
jgi:hypothetical protein